MELAEIKTVSKILSGIFSINTELNKRSENSQ